MNEKSYEKPIKKLLLLLSLLIISPLILTLAFKAERVYKDFPQSIIYYTLLVLGVFLILFTVYWGFKTFQSFLKILFNE